MDHGKPTKRHMLDNHINDNDYVVIQSLKLQTIALKTIFLTMMIVLVRKVKFMRYVAGLRAHWIMASDWFDI